MYFVGGKKLFLSFDFFKTQFDLSKWTKAFKKDYSKQSVLCKTFHNVLFECYYYVLSKNVVNYWTMNYPQVIRLTLVLRHRTQSHFRNVGTTLSLVVHRAHSFPPSVLMPWWLTGFWISEWFLITVLKQYTGCFHFMLYFASCYKVLQSYWPSWHP